MTEVPKAEGGGVHRVVRSQWKQTHRDNEDFTSRQDVHDVTVEHVFGKNYVNLTLRPLSDDKDALLTESENDFASDIDLGSSFFHFSDFFIILQLVEVNFFRLILLPKLKNTDINKLFFK